MLSKFKTFINFRHPFPRGVRLSPNDPLLVNGVLRFLCNPSCNMSESPSPNELLNTPESPEIPDWVKFCENESSSAAGSDDDFVIPAVAEWVENLGIWDRSRVVRSLPNETAQSDVDIVTEILKKGFPSPEAVVEALSGCSVNVSTSMVEQLLKRFNNDWILALGVFMWAKAQPSYVHSPNIYNEIIDILGKRKEFDLMWELVEQMHRERHCVSLFTVSKVARRLAKAGRWDHAIDAFRKIEQYGISKDVSALNMLMDSLVKGNSVEHAYKVFSEFKDQIRPDVRTFNILTHGWCRTGRVEGAKKCMEEMEQYGLHPDGITYTSLIEAYCCDKNFCKVDAVLDEMRKKEIRPSVVTYTIIMHALGKAKEITKALKVYEQMKQSACEPDAPFYSSLIYVLSVSGRLNDAFEVFEDMKKQGLSPDVMTYNTMIMVACRNDKEESALKLLKEMEDVSCKPDLKTYAPLLKMCCRNKRMKVLHFLLAHMLKNDISIELGTYSLLVNSLCKSGKLEHACLFFEELVLKGMVPMDSTCKQLISELDKKNMHKAKKLIETLMLQTGKEHVDVTSRKRAIQPSGLELVC